jgi:hypothetical protein
MENRDIGIYTNLFVDLQHSSNLLGFLHDEHTAKRTERILMSIGN